MSQTINGVKEYSIYQKKCERLLLEPEIRFAGIINHMGHLAAGGFKKGITPLEDDSERQKMYMELALRVSMRMDFDNTLGPVKYTASQRSKALMMSFPLGNKVLMVSAEPGLSVDKTTTKIIKIFGI